MNNLLTLKLFDLFPKRIGFIWDGEYVLFDFQPKLDITVFELALVFKIFSNGMVHHTEQRYDMLIEAGLIRHFKKME